MDSRRIFLQTLFEKAVQTCVPSVCLNSHLDNIDTNNGICVIGAGKASAEMAAAVYAKYGNICYGKVVTRYGYGTELPTGDIEVLFAAHPVPDENSYKSGLALLELVKRTPANIPIIFLISGGGSSLISVPVEGIGFSDKMALNRFLLASGAPVDQMNVVRKQLSAVKGGRLRKTAKSDCYTYVISDVVGDDPSLIASGPTIDDNSTPSQALDILNKYEYPKHSRIIDYLKSAVQMPQEQPRKAFHQYSIVANANKAIDSAIAVANEAGWQTQVLNYEQQGEAAEVAKQHASIALKLQEEGKKILLFSGGELTVTIKGDSGDGGPNQEYLLALAIEFNSATGIAALSCDTDGVDGSKDVAGGYIDEFTLLKAQQKGMDPQLYLNNHNSYQFLKQIDSLVVTGPTKTNVNDFRVIMIS